MNIRLDMKQAVRICFLMFIVCGFIALSTPSYAASTVSYDLVQQFPEEFKDYRQVFEPGDVAFDSAGNAYVADFGYDVIIKYDAAGDYVTHWQVVNINGISLDPLTNQLYVSRTNNVIEIYNDNGDFLHTFGSSGTNTGQFRTIS